MSETLFISDLHLSAETNRLTTLFFEFLDVECRQADTLYILGDLFDYWLGDDLMGDFELELCRNLQKASKRGLKIYFLPGNRDFLVGRRFFQLSGSKRLRDSSCINLDGKKVLLKHGDDLCTLDKLHQRFRRLTSKPWVQKLFLALPKQKRREIAVKIRKKGRSRDLSQAEVDVVDTQIVKEMQRFSANVLIHGHTHQPMVRYLSTKSAIYNHVVLPDWDKKWGYLSYTFGKDFKLIYKQV